MNRKHYTRLKTTASSILLLTSLLTQSAFANQVSLYGQMDIGYARGNGGTAEGKDKFQMTGQGKNASFWGMRGTEQINADLKALFHLEAFLNAENGAMPNGFNRASYIGMEGKWGTLKLGRQLNASYEIMSQFDIGQDYGTSYSSRNANIYIAGFYMSPFGGDQSRSDSMLTYYSPRMNGLRLGTSFIAKNDNIYQGRTTREGVNSYELGADYKWSGLTVGATYKSKPFNNDNRLTATGTRDEVSSAWAIAAKYDFQNNLSLSAGYLDNHLKEDGKGYFIGASYTTGPFKFGGQFAHNTYKGIDGKQPMAISMYARYSLSKRTDIYALIGAIDNDAKDVIGAEHNETFMFGIRHKF